MAGVGATGSWPQVLKGDFCARAACQEPLRRCESRSREQALGRPEHEVEPVASTDLQPADRATHLTPKATSLAPAPKCSGCCGGIWCAAGVQEQECNVRDSSLQPKSGQARSCTHESKSCCAQRQSVGIPVPDGAVPSVPWEAVRHNLAGRNGPCCGHSCAAGKRERFAGQTGPNDSVGEELIDKVSTTAKAARGRRQAGNGGRLRLKNPPCERDDLQAVGRAAQNFAQSLFAGASPQNAVSRRPLVNRVREIRMRGSIGGVGSEPGLRAV